MVIKRKTLCNGWDAVICVNDQGKLGCALSFAFV